MSDRYRRYLRIALTVVAVLFVFRFIGGCFHPKGGLKATRTVKAIQGDLIIKISSTGEVKPQNRVEIKPPISGRIEEIRVQEGQNVKQGDILAWMSSTDRAALLDSARAQGPEIYKKWEDAYKPAPLLAPLDGTVIVRALEPGQTVTTADPVVVLSDRLIVKAQVDETDLALIKLEQPVEIRLDAYPAKKIKAKVVHISYESILINNVNIYEVDILPEEIPETFRSGMTATVTFFVAERRGVVLVPSEAVSSQMGAKNAAGSFVVYKKSFGGKLKHFPVEIGESDGRMTEITSGLKPGASLTVVRREEQNTGSNPFSMNRGPQQRGGGGPRGG